MNHPRNNQGFSLIELLLSLALTTLFIPLTTVLLLDLFIESSTLFKQYLKKSEQLILKQRLAIELADGKVVKQAANSFVIYGLSTKKYRINNRNIQLNQPPYHYVTKDHAISNITVFNNNACIRFYEGDQELFTVCSAGL